MSTDEHILSLSHIISTTESHQYLSIRYADHLLMEKEVSLIDTFGCKNTLFSLKRSLKHLKLLMWRDRRTELPAHFCLSLVSS